MAGPGDNNSGMTSAEMAARIRTAALEAIQSLPGAMLGEGQINDIIARTGGSNMNLAQRLTDAAIPAPASYYIVQGLWPQGRAMIIKGHARARARQLAQHLSDTSENEQVSVHSARGVIASDIHGAMAEMALHAKRGRSTRPLYHASISPEPGQSLSDAQIAFAADRLETKLELSGQPRLIVTHRKLGRDHVHVVWSRIRVDGTAVSDSWSYAKHEAVARELERAFGHERVEGAHGAPRPAGRKRPAHEYELRQERRSGRKWVEIATEVQALWAATGSGEEFKRALEEAGYSLVRGDRRGLVVLDQAGEAHSLARLVGLPTAGVRRTIKDLELSGLPAVAEKRRMLPRWKKESGAEPARLGTTIVTVGAVRAKGLRRLVRFGSLKGVGADRARALAAIRSAFASKIADVCAYAPKGEVRARIERLEIDEAASIAVVHAQSGTSPHTAGFREAATALVLRRFDRKSLCSFRNP